MKKKIKIFAIIVIILIGIITIFAFNANLKAIYALGNVKELLNSGKESDNLYVSYKMESKDASIVIDTFMKDNYIYEVCKDEKTSEIKYESFFNPENSEKAIVMYSEKMINISKESIDNISINSENDNFFIMSEKMTSEYKYIKKEKANGKKCIKVCITDEQGDKITKDYYYIDLEDNQIIMHESYEGTDSKRLEKNFKETYNYSYDLLTEENIKKFDINKYPEYKVNKIEKQ